MSDGPCRICGEQTESLAGNPSRWPLVFCWKDEPGVPKHHHTRCVFLKLVEGEDWKARAYEASTLNAELHRIVSVVRENVYELMEGPESNGECSFCGKEMTAQRMAEAAAEHDEECPIGRIRRVLLEGDR